METSELLAIVTASINAERVGLTKASHPHVIAAHNAALRDLSQRAREVRQSHRLSDKVRIEA